MENTSLISSKSDCIEALESCIQNCLDVIERHKCDEEMRPCVELSELCIAAFVDCIAAVESVQANRSQFMLVCVDISNACIANFESNINLVCQKCGLPCKDFMDEPAPKKELESL